VVTFGDEVIIDVTISNPSLQAKKKDESEIATTLTFTLTLMFSLIVDRSVLAISLSTFFFACKLGLLIVTSIITSSPKVTTFFIFSFSTKIKPN
jgi:hypothetical protein